MRRKKKKSSVVLKRQAVFWLILLLGFCPSLTQVGSGADRNGIRPAKISSEWFAALPVQAAQTSSAQYPSDSIFNFRDMGGYTGFKGKKIKKGLLYRSGELCYASRRDLARLKALHVGLVVDFRGSMERNYCPDQRIEGARYRNIPMVKTTQTKEKAAKRYASVKAALAKGRGKKVFAKQAKISGQKYLHNLFFTSYSRKQYRRFFSLLLETKGKKAVLFHCIHGKDRTGAGAALIMMALGASDKDIIAEYMRTNESVRAAGVKTSTGEYGVKKTHLQKELKKIKEKYGTYEKYLKKAIGLTNQELKALRRYYLE